MASPLIPEKLRRLQLTGTIEVVSGNGHLPVVKVRTPWSTAEVFLHGAHVAHFQKNGEPPLLFMSPQSHFAEGQAIRGGVPICYPWFGPREGDVSHGYSRFHGWELVKTSAAANGTVTLQFALPKLAGRQAWQALRTEFIVTIGETLTMELVATNETCGETFTIENCLHSYFYVGNINRVSITGLEGAVFDDFALGAGGAPKPACESPLHITQETNRVYPDNTAMVEIRDEELKRTVRVEKFNSLSTVVWNPWTTQKMPEDWGSSDHLNMVCVESGNVKQNRISLAPGKTPALKVVLSSR